MNSLPKIFLCAVEPKIKKQSFRLKTNETIVDIELLKDTA